VIGCTCVRIGVCSMNGPRRCRGNFTDSLSGAGSTAVTPAAHSPTSCRTRTRMSCARPYCSHLNCWARLRVRPLLSFRSPDESPEANTLPRKSWISRGLFPRCYRDRAAPKVSEPELGLDNISDRFLPCSVWLPVSLRPAASFALKMACLQPPRSSNPT